MAPTKPKPLHTNKIQKGVKRSSSTPTSSKNRVSKKPKLPPPKQQKTKSAPKPLPRKRKEYTDTELGIPKLNMVTPVGVSRPRGKKKGKVFVDDQESMMTILAMVNANIEGKIESKMMKRRQLEEIREARQKEIEARREQRKAELEQVKDSLREKRRRKPAASYNEEVSTSNSNETRNLKPVHKKVNFA